MTLNNQTTEVTERGFTSSQSDFSDTDGSFELTATTQQPTAGSDAEGMPLVQGPTTQTLLIIAGMGILLWLLIRGRMKRRKQVERIRETQLRFNGNAKLEPIQFNGTKSLGAPPDVLNWQLELYDLGRELKGELDSKMLAVRKITRQYDQAVVRLSELIKLAEQVEMGDGGHLKGASNDKPSPIATLYAKAIHLSAAGWSSQRIAENLGLNLADTELLLSAVIANCPRAVDAALPKSEATS